MSNNTLIETNLNLIVIIVKKNLIIINLHIYMHINLCIYFITFNEDMINYVEII